MEQRGGGGISLRQFSLIVSEGLPEVPCSTPVGLGSIEEKNSGGKIFTNSRKTGVGQPETLSTGVDVM